MESDKTLKVAIQGYEGSFHDVAARKYWPAKKIELLPADSFDILGQMLKSGEADIAVMAIENSIAGSILICLSTCQALSACSPWTVKTTRSI